MSDEMIPAYRSASWISSRSSLNVRHDISSYLRRSGWAPLKSGRMGELWHRANEVDLAIPFELESSSPEFALIVRRIAETERRDAAEVLVSVEREFQDVQNYRIADRYVVDEAVLLETAATVTTGARRLIRAAATTARRPRPNIGSNYSRPADDLAAKARMAHTRHGSFVLPVIMPVEPPEPGEDEIFTQGTVIEPGERRVTRTLATALAALDNIVVRPDREPGADGLYELVQRGVSREVVAAIRMIANDPGVHAFDTTFFWAPGLGDPGRIPRQVLITSDASPLLARLEERLAEAPPDEDQTVSGPIIEIRHINGEPAGEIAIQTIRNSRYVEVRITVGEDVILSAHDWAKQNRALIVRGAIVTVQGRLSIPEPDHVGPIDDLFVVRELE